MNKFVKTALLKVKERNEPQEIQLEEVRTDTAYKSLNDGLEKSHTNIETSLNDRLEAHYKKTYEKFYEELLDDAGLYSRKGSYEKPLGFMVDTNNIGVNEETLEKQLKSKRTK
jgi:hypothetical protein